MVSALFFVASLQSDDLAKHVYPLAKRVPCPPVVVDASDFPEGQEWGEKAKALVEAWFSQVSSMLAVDGRDPLTGKEKDEPYKAPAEFKIVIRKEIRAPAFASGGTITINGKWITDHPDDLGMVIHEMVHVLQQYPNSQTKPGWLVEGIADYIRWWRYEPELHATSGRTRINKERSKYTDSYRTTAVWLAWCSRKYDMRLVPCLDKALRDREDPMPVFEKLMGKDADALWAEFAAEIG